MESFLRQAVSLAERPVVSGSSELIDQLEEAACAKLPRLFREFLERASGFNSAIYADSVDERVYYGGNEFYELHELISMQSRLVLHGALGLKLGAPFFVLGGVTGPGSAMVLVGADDDPPVIHVQGPNDDPHMGSGSLLGERFTNYLDGLLLSDRLLSASRSRPIARFVEFEPARVLFEDEVSQVLREFDSIISRLCSSSLSENRAVGLRNVVDVDHKWIAFAQKSPIGSLVVGSDSVANLTDGLILMCLGLALLRCVGGSAVDHRGLLGNPGQTTYNAEGVLAALQAHQVTGGLDELVLSFRQALEAFSEG